MTMEFSDFRCLKIYSSFDVHFSLIEAQKSKFKSRFHFRLFNKDCGKGGEGIDDLPAILNEAIPATMKNMDASAEDVSNVAATYTAIIERIHTGALKEGPPLQLIKDSLINSRQSQQFINVLRVRSTSKPLCLCQNGRLDFPSLRSFCSDHLLAVMILCNRPKKTIGPELMPNK